MHGLLSTNSDHDVFGRKIKKAFTYNVTVDAADKPVTLLEVKTHLRLDIADASQDTYLNLLIDGATDFGEKFTKREFINKTFTTFRDTFWDCLELRRSRTSSVSSIKYLLDGVLTTLSTDVYGFTDVNDFSKIFLKEDQVYPTDADLIPQAIEIIFIAGYGADDTDVPADVKLALLNYIAFLYENRGDCSCDTSDINNLPAATRSLFNKIRIMDIGSCT